MQGFKVSYSLQGPKPRYYLPSDLMGPLVTMLDSKSLATWRTLKSLKCIIQVTTGVHHKCRLL